MKKAIGIFSCLLLAATMISPTHAAESLNASEQSLYDELKNYSYESDERIYTVSDNLLKKIEAYMLREEVDLQTSQSTSIASLAKDAMNYMAKSGFENTDDLSKGDITYLMEDYVVKIGNELGLVITYDDATGNLTIKDKNDDIVFDGDPIKDTGFSANPSSVITEFLFICSIAGALILLRKRTSQNILS